MQTWFCHPKPEKALAPPPASLNKAISTPIKYLAWRVVLSYLRVGKGRDGSRWDGGDSEDGVMSQSASQGAT